MPVNKRTNSRPPQPPVNLDKNLRTFRNVEQIPTARSSIMREPEAHLQHDFGSAVSHVQLPLLPVETNQLVEVFMYLFSLLTLALQYIHVYKTVWWLPYSHSNYALNFYLIDPYICVFIVVMLSRRVVFASLAWILLNRSPNRWMRCLSWACRVVVGLGFGLTLLWTGYKAKREYSLGVYLLILLYPFIVYGALFKLRFLPFLGKSVLVQTTRERSANNKLGEIRIYPFFHSCSPNPDTIRHETELLKNDFNQRLKQVLYNSFFSAYYAGFVPVCLTQSTLHYDTLWVWQHLSLMWFTMFLLYFLHFLSSRYLDILHCCSLHLGKWSKVEGRHIQTTTAWSELQLWPHSALVKHVKGHFRAECYVNAAEPGNNMHLRFHFLFYHPLRVSHGLLVLASALVTYEFINLGLASEWSQILSLCFLLFTAYYILFKLMRDTLALRKVYHTDECWY